MTENTELTNWVQNPCNAREINVALANLFKRQVSVQQEQPIENAEMNEGG